MIIISFTTCSFVNYNRLSQQEAFFSDEIYSEVESNGCDDPVEDIPLKDYGKKTAYVS